MIFCTRKAADGNGVRFAPRRVNDVDLSGEEVPVQTVTGMSPASSTERIHRDFHGHWFPYEYVTEQFTWDNIYCDKCRSVLLTALDYADKFGPERTEVLAHWNHLILNHVISEYRIPRGNAGDEDEGEDEAL